MLPKAPASPLVTPQLKGTQARVLLASVFGSCAQDDEFGSRASNPIESYHNQVTRAHGAFSLRMFRRLWGIMMIQANISPARYWTSLSAKRSREATSQHDDVVGISSIIMNIGKARELCHIVRKLSPNSTIVLGGHITAIPAIKSLTDADHYVLGEGISWMRSSEVACRTGHVLATLLRTKR